MVTRHILEQTRRNGDDLAAVKSRLDRHDQRFDGLERRFDGLERKVDNLTKSLPKIVGDVMRDVLQERDKERRAPPLSNRIERLPRPVRGLEDDPPAHHRHQRLDLGDGALLHRERISAQDREIGE